MANTISKVIHNGTEYQFEGVNGGVTSVNGNTGAVTVNETIISSTAPANPTQGMVRYDTTNDELKSYDGTNWNPTGAVTSVNGQTGAVTVSEFSPTSAGSTDQVLTKTAGGYDWATPAASGIQNDTVGTTSRIDYARLGDTTEYTAVTKAEGKVYLVY